jgi:hypothetical protein
MNSRFAGEGRKTMEVAWGSLIATASGAVIAVVSVWLTNAGHTRRQRTQLDHEREKSAREFRRASGEDLYQLVDNWLENLNQIHLLQWRVLSLQLARDHADEIIRDNFRSKPSNLGRIEMLIKAYFPSIEPSYKATLDARTAVNKVVANFDQQLKATGNLPREPFATLQKIQPTFDAAAESLKMAIINEIRASTLAP